MGLLTKEITDHLFYSSSTVRNLMEYEVQAAIADATLEKFPKAKAELSSYGGVTVTIEILKVQDAKDLLRYLAREHDLHIVEAPTKKTYGAAGWRWKLGRNGVDAFFGVTAVFKDAPEATCRMVQVGTETVERPVYEMKCDNGDLADVETLDDDMVQKPDDEDAAVDAAAEAATEDHDPRELGQ